ncbi:MAG: phosphotriesterase [Bacteroidota bacterium]|nr:phosphotriesterase [Bacteroidota bacterium]
MKNDDDLTLKIILWIILFLVFGIIIITCNPSTRDYVMTVNGQESPGKMGTTLEHEHILVDFIGADSTGYFRWNRDSVIKNVLPLVIEAKNRGVKTIVDCTPAWLGRDPLLLRSISRQAGINFITNTGYYGANKNKFIPESFYTSDAQEVANIWIKEFENGIEDTGIKPGFIKIAVDPADTLSPEHRKLITAAAIAHLKTGLVIASHTGPDNPAFAQIEILKSLGVDPSAFIWVHAQRGTPEGNIKAAKEGAWISLDNVRKNTGTPEFYADRIAELKKEGLLNKVLISHDSGWYDPAKPGGGQINGYTDIFDSFIPLLRARGFTNDEINQVLVRNPREAFKVRIRKLGI